MSGTGSDVAEGLLSGTLPSGTREAPAGVTAADQSDMNAVCSFAQHYGLTILEENAAGRTVQVQGTAQQMDEAFKIKLVRATDSKGGQYLTYKGALSIPESLAGIVTAVLGLDQRPVAKHHGAG